MARTRATVAAKVSSGKSSKARSNAAPLTNVGTSGERERLSRNYSGGNPVCPRETPIWQRPITNFFITNKDKDCDGDEAGSSKSKPRRNVIQSDDEECEASIDKEQPKNNELDESISLEPLSGENSHKIDEYYVKKDKGNGKKTNDNGDKGKKNMKRSHDETTSDDENIHLSKKTKPSSTDQV